MHSIGYDREIWDGNLTILIELFDDGTRSLTNIYEWNSEAPE